MIPSCFIRCYVVAAVGSVGLGWVDIRLEVGGKPHSTHALTDGQPGNVMHLAPKIGRAESKVDSILGDCDQRRHFHYSLQICLPFKGKRSPYSITERRVPELIPVLGSQPAGDVSHKPGGRLPLLFARPSVTPATLKRAATNFADW